MRIYILILLLAVISGCSTQFAYKHLDWIIFWYSEDFVTLDENQQNLFEENVLTLLDWHKSSELPLYQQQLIKLKNDFNNGELNKASIELHREAIYKHWISIRSKVNSQAIPLIKKLNNGQIEGLFSELQKNNKERLEDYSKLNSDEKLELFSNRWIDTIKTVLGSTNEQQLIALKGYISTQHDLTTLRLDYLSSYQAELQNAMMDPMNTSKVISLLDNPIQYQSEQYQIKLKENKISTSAYLAELIDTLTLTQKNHFNKFITDQIDWIDSIKLDNS